jgi:hypothetical protein
MPTILRECGVGCQEGKIPGMDRMGSLSCALDRRADQGRDTVDFVAELGYVALAFRSHGGVAGSAVRSRAKLSILCRAQETRAFPENPQSCNLGTRNS